MGLCADISYSYLIIGESGHTVYIVIEEETQKEKEKEKFARAAVRPRFASLPDHDYQCKAEVVNQKTRRSKRKLKSKVVVNTKNDKKAKGKRCPSCKVLLPNLKEKPSQKCGKTAYKCLVCGEVYLDKPKFETHCTNNCSNTVETDVCFNISSQVNSSDVVKNQDLESTSSVPDLQNGANYEIRTTETSAAQNLIKLAFKCQVCSDVYLGETNFQSHRVSCRTTPKRRTIKTENTKNENLEIIVVGDGEKIGTALPQPDKSIDVEELLLHDNTQSEGEYNNDACDIDSHANTCDIDDTDLRDIPKVVDTRGARKGRNTRKATKVAFTCKVCRRIFVGSSNFKMHSHRCKEGNTNTDNCTECGIVFELNMAQKRRRRSLGKGSRCPTCYAVYRRETRNDQRRQRSVVKPNLCDLCGKSFATRLRLTTHSLTHTGLKPFKCEYCDLSFSRKDYLKRHLGVHVPKGRTAPLRYEGLSETDVAMRLAAAEEVHRCEQCVAVFAQETELDAHRSRHAEQRRFMCDRCPKVFSQKLNLMIHYRMHTNERPYKCDLCDSAFTHQLYLKVHKLRHTGEKPFKCQECEAAFVTKSALQTHFRTHTGEKPFKCTECVSEFNSAGGLVKHRRIHETGNEERPFKCYICGGGFLRKRNLVLHLRVHEGAKYVPTSLKQELT